MKRRGYLMRTGRGGFVSTVVPSGRLKAGAALAACWTRVSPRSLVGMLVRLLVRELQWGLVLIRPLWWARLAFRMSDEVLAWLLVRMEKEGLVMIQPLVLESGRCWLSGKDR